MFETYKIDNSNIPCISDYDLIYLQDILYNKLSKRENTRNVTDFCFFCISN